MIEHHRLAQRMSCTFGHGHIRRKRPGSLDHRCLRNAGSRQEHSLDLAQFDAYSTDLDLLIRAAQELELTGSVPSHHVPGAVHTLTSAGSTEGRSDKTLRGERRRKVPSRQSVSHHVQLPRGADRSGQQRRIQHHSGNAVDRAPDRSITTRLERLAHECRDGCFTGPVRIHDVDVTRPRIH